MYYVCMIYGIWSKQFLSDKIRYLKSDMSKLPKGYKIYRNRICHARVLIDNGYRQFSERSEQGQKSRFKPLQTSDFYYCNLKLSDYGNMNRRKFHEKFDTYIDAGLVPGEDVVFVYFGSNRTPDE